MTNEELVLKIKEGGHVELIPVLWEKNQKLLYMLSDQFYRRNAELIKSRGFDRNDIRQESYFALLTAIKYYNSESEYKFTSYFNYAILRAIRELLGHKSDILNQADRLEEPLKDDENSLLTLADTVEDRGALDFVNNYEINQILQMLYEALRSLPETEQIIIKGYYFLNKSQSQIAREIGVSTERVRQMRCSILWKLRRIKLHRLMKDLNYKVRRTYHDGYGNFKNNGISAVEYIACERADMINLVKECPEDCARNIS